jgi:bacteriorhodopsin
MADIDVVPKRKSNVWLWVLIALVVIAVLWMVFGRSQAPATGQLFEQTPATLASVTAVQMMG